MNNSHGAGDNFSDMHAYFGTVKSSPVKGWGGLSKKSKMSFHITSHTWGDSTNHKSSKIIELSQ